MGSTLEQSLYGGYLIIRPEPIGLCAARRHVNLLAKNFGFAEDDTADIIIAVGEAMSNAYLYGTPDSAKNCIYLGWHCKDDTLIITINDEGYGIDSDKKSSKSCKLTESRGCGIPLMRETMDNVHFDYQDGAMVVLKKRLSRFFNHSKCLIR